MKVKNVDFHADLGIIALKSHSDFAAAIDGHIVNARRKQGLDTPDSFIIPTQQHRFSNGEGKIILKETARAKDIYVICDVGNYSCTYELYGHLNRMGPDEHFQDIKRAVAAIGGKAARVSVMMPLLYASRQDRNKGRESLDCALALQELQQLGVKDIITFDAHNSTVQNAVPLLSFENLYTAYQIINALVDDEADVVADADNMLIISPDLGGMERALYYSSVLGVNVGMFYKRRDYTKIEYGRNPIIQHDYIGQDVKGKNVLIIDDMLASGESLIGIISEMRQRGAKKIFAAVTFALFTKGADTFAKLYADDKLTRVYATNLTYLDPKIEATDWFRRVDISPFAASIIDRLNSDNSIAPVLDSTDNLADMIRRLRA